MVQKISRAKTPLWAPLRASHIVTPRKHPVVGVPTWVLLFVSTSKHFKRTKSEVLLAKVSRASRQQENHFSCQRQSRNSFLLPSNPTNLHSLSTTHPPHPWRIVPALFARVSIPSFLGLPSPTWACTRGIN